MRQPSNFVDLTGQRYGRLTVVSRAPNGSAGQARWHCRCDCGETAVVWGSSLRSGNTQSCGCLQRERASQSNSRHHMSASPEYVSYRRMLQRCYFPGSNRWDRYGGRGIEVCERWRGDHGFENFLADMGPKPHPRLTLERVDNDGNYDPGNCVWATYRRQALNSSKTRFVEYEGRKQALADLCDRFGIGIYTVVYRINKRHMTVHDALTVPVPIPSPGVFVDGHGCP
jgi:hypothetical protein